jgi:cytochrome c oxidase subunit IV
MEYADGGSAVAATADGAHAHAGLAHVVPMKILAAVFAALVLLTIVTVAATEVDLGRFNLYVALAIAGVKASLVALYFMHLRYDRPFNAVVFLGCLLFAVIFISMVLTDTQAYFPSISTGQAPDMQGVHTPFGR